MLESVSHVSISLVTNNMMRSFVDEETYQVICSSCTMCALTVYLTGTHLEEIDDIDYKQSVLCR